MSNVEVMVDGSTDPLREKFTGKEFDEDGDGNGASGIQAYHFGFRVYDPEVGIWNRPDPLEQFWNAFSYCGVSPVNFVDPTGLKVDWEEGYNESQYKEMLSSQAGLEAMKDYATINQSYSFQQMYELWSGGSSSGSGDNTTSNSSSIVNATRINSFSSYPKDADVLRSDIQHSTASRDMAKINADVDAELAMVPVAVGLSIAAQDFSVKRAEVVIKSVADRLSKQLASSKYAQA